MPDHSRTIEIVEFSSKHDSELSWYFLQSTSVLGDRSTFGGQLHALEAASSDSDGDRVASKASVDANVWRVRTARVFAGWPAIGEFDPSLDAQPIQGRDRGHDGYTPNDADLRRFTEVSRVLREIPSADIGALACYYLRGERWQDAGDHARLTPVITLTPAGKRLLELRQRRREESGQDEDKLQPDERIAAEMVADKTMTDIQRRMILVSAIKQAQTMLTEARLRYAAVRGEL